MCKYLHILFADANIKSALKMTPEKFRDASVFKNARDKFDGNNVLNRLEKLTTCNF